MELIFLYTLPMLISFFLMNECYKRRFFNHPHLAALGCIIPGVNWICLIIYMCKLYDN